MGVHAALCTVTKAYGRRSVLRGVTLRIPPRTVVGLIGANGSGKTTLLRILLGLITEDEGIVTVGGVAPSVSLARYRVVYFGGGTTLPEDVRVCSWASLFGVTGDLGRDRRRLGALSRGQRQLIGLRVALSKSRADLIVLDEPWDGLDPDGSGWLSERVRVKRAMGAAVLVSSHRFADLVDVCDRYAVLDRGVVTNVDPSRIEHTMSPEDLRIVYRRVTSVVE